MPDITLPARTNNDLVPGAHTPIPRTGPLYRTGPAVNEFHWEQDGHHGMVHADVNSSGPSTWQAVCSCGWNGRTFTNAGMPGDRPEYALRELLTHAGINPVQYSKDASDRALEALQGAGNVPVDIVEALMLANLVADILEDTDPGVA